MPTAFMQAKTKAFQVAAFEFSLSSSFALNEVLDSACALSFTFIDDVFSIRFLASFLRRLLALLSLTRPL